MLLSSDRTSIYSLHFHRTGTYKQLTCSRQRKDLHNFKWIDKIKIEASKNTGLWCLGQEVFSHQPCSFILLFVFWGKQPHQGLPEGDSPAGPGNLKVTLQRDFPFHFTIFEWVQYYWQERDKNRLFLSLCRSWKSFGSLYIHKQVFSFLKPLFY